ncbi:hypothetical protein AUP43_08325 [Oceanibaculum pacificum]|uniref:Uncharacterized protein n=2 Tax=Oceanibaculum pacificum TaxID=580166 RepID=A0A154W5J8_9PROT|nr:hypothetical protein AUP43_08325 [Oceanibaculum pacificum]
MAKKRILPLFIVMAGLVTTGIAGVFAPTGAQAQGLNNQPFRFGGGGISVGGGGLGGGGGSVGMSTAYRQAILNQELRNSTPTNLLRDRSGALVTVERGPSGQAFVSSPVQPYLVQSFRPAGLGYGIAASSHAFSRWVGMIDPVGLPIHAGVTPMDSRAPSIDAWISQLASLGPAE